MSFETLLPNRHGPARVGFGIILSSCHNSSSPFETKLTTPAAHAECGDLSPLWYFFSGCDGRWGNGLRRKWESCDESQQSKVIVGKGEASLSLPVVATGSIPCIYHGASFSHGRPRQNCLVVRNTASLHHEITKSLNISTPSRLRCLFCNRRLSIRLIRLCFIQRSRTRSQLSK